MAKRKAGRTAQSSNSTQSDDVMQLIRESTALQVEMLGAAARVWSEIVERVAAYNQELTNELMNFSGGETDANASLNRLVSRGKEHVRALGDLPQKIGEGFQMRVRRRAGRPSS
jgi:hypothetical protein